MKKNGFTLTELLAAIVIMAILIGIAIPVYFNISKSAKENEYTSKKTYLESMAQRYAEENNISNTTKISVSRLVSAGYAGAESYTGDHEMPFISNPVDEEDNLACRVVTLSVENYEISATISETSDCAFAESDLADSKLGIKAYEFTNNKIGNQLTYSEGTTYNWTNKDVLIVVNPEYENFKSLSITTSGHTTLVDSNHMLKNPIKDQVVNINNFTNVVLINASVITKQSVNVALELEGTIATSTVDVRIDKESPTVDTQKFSGWTSTSKGATVYLSDGAGSGAKGVYVGETNDFSKRDTTLKVNKNNPDSISITNVNGKKLGNQRYYLWAVDNAGNVSPQASYIDISNIDDEDPIVTSVSITSNKSGYNSVNTTVKIFANDGNGSGITYACVKTTPGYSDCKWKVFGNGSYINTNYNVPGATEGNGNSYTLYAYVKDAVENVSESTYKTSSYKMYTRCSDVTFTAWSECSAKCNGGKQSRSASDKYLGSACPAKNETQDCNKMDCCSKTHYTNWTSCNVLCGVGTQTRQKVSDYDGRVCANESQNCDTGVNCCSKLNYGAWSACPACGAATKTRTKTSAYNGQSCGTETVSCGLPECCSKLNYGAWSACSNACGGTQTRAVTSAYNGQSCGTQSQACGGKSSSIDYNSCSAGACGVGQYKRNWTSTLNGQSCGTTWDGGACDGSNIYEVWWYSSDKNFTAPCDGLYNFDLYGGQGGGDGGKAGGLGAYLNVQIRAKAGTVFTLDIGGMGKTSDPKKADKVAGGKNGGGTAYWSGGGGGRSAVSIGSTLYAAAAGGGGATFGIAGHNARCSGSDNLNSSWKGESSNGKDGECLRDAGAGGAGYTRGGAAGRHEDKNTCGVDGTGGYGGVSGWNSSTTKKACSGGDNEEDGFISVDIASW